MNRIVVLNSGGFDSVCLMHEVREAYPDWDIYSLFFDYGQPNVKEERACAEKVAEKLEAIFYEIKLPEFYWTRSTFYSGKETTSEDNYLEMRNLVFFSYAISLSESLEAEKIFAAVLKSFGYTDTSTEFLVYIRNLASMKGIDFRTPFSEMEKLDLLQTVQHFKIQPEDVFTCNYPNNGKPCGECVDCKVVQEIFRMVKPQCAVHSYLENKNISKNSEFQDFVKNSPIEEIRVMHNNSCQLKCRHCYYGFSEMKSDPLTREEMTKVLEDSWNLGIKSFHFSGKEPLFDEEVFWYINYIRQHFFGAKISIVSNGINVPKYIESLKKYDLEKLSLSVDDIYESNGVRKVSSVSEKALSALQNTDIPVEIFVDLHKNNFSMVYNILKYLYEKFGVFTFYLRTIVTLPNNKDEEVIKLSVIELENVIRQLKNFGESYPDTHTTLVVTRSYSAKISEEHDTNLEIVRLYKNQEEYHTISFLDNVDVYFEFYCGRYENQITITPDGYILGCPSELSCDYTKLAVGNVREYSLKDLVVKGKEKMLSDNILMQKNFCKDCWVLENSR